MLEVLALTACLKGVACSEVSSAYYESSILLQQTAKTTSEKAQRIAGKEVYTAASYLLYMGLNRPVTIQIYKNYNAIFHNNTIALNYTKTF